jgi:hypothetical protein
VCPASELVVEDPWFEIRSGVRATIVTCAARNDARPPRATGCGVSASNFGDLINLVAFAAMQGLPTNPAAV